MKMRIQFLSGSQGVKARLQQDGWMFESQDGDGSFVRHPFIPDEEDARRRLQRLGLLTTRALRIEFLNLSDPIHE